MARTVNSKSTQTYLNPTPLYILRINEVILKDDIIIPTNTMQYNQTPRDKIPPDQQTNALISFGESSSVTYLKDSQMKTLSRFKQLPSEVLELVIDNLDVTSTLQMSRTSRKYYQLCHRNSHWKSLLIRSFGEELTSNRKLMNYQEIYRDHHNFFLRMREGRARLKYFAGHIGIVYTLTFFSGRLVSGGSDRCIKIWDVETGECVETKGGESGHQGRVLRLRSYTDNMISCSSDGVIMIWSAEFQVIRHLREDGVRVRDVHRAGDFLVALATDRKIRVWDKVRSTPEIIQGDRNIMALSAHGDIIAMASSDSTIIIYNVQKGIYLKTFNDKPGFYATLLHLDGRYLYSTNRKAEMKVWDLTTEGPSYTTIEHAETVRSFAVIGKIFITCGYDKTIKLWDRPTGQCLAIYKHQDPSWVMDLVTNGPCIFSTGVNGLITSLNFGYDLSSIS